MLVLGLVSNRGIHGIDNHLVLPEAVCCSFVCVPLGSFCAVYCGEFLLQWTVDCECRDFVNLLLIG